MVIEYETTYTRYSTWSDDEHRMVKLQMQRYWTITSYWGFWWVGPWCTQSKSMKNYHTDDPHSKYLKKIFIIDKPVFYWQYRESDEGRTQ